MRKYTFKKLLLWLSLLSATLLLATLGFAFHYLHKPLTLPQEGIVQEVKSGSSLRQVTRLLVQAGYLDHPQWLVVYAYVRGKTSIKAGEYELQPNMTPAQLLDKLNRGDVIQHQITLVEGKTFRQILQALWQEEKLDK